MSIESKIEALTKAVQDLTVAMGQSATSSPAPAAPVAAPVATQMPAAPFQAPAAPVAPVAAPAAPAAAPFNDAQGLMAYVMQKYQALGADKGAKIQEVLVGLGYSNVTDVKTEHYGDFYAKVEAL